jgi:hypothetical protein
VARVFRDADGRVVDGLVPPGLRTLSDRAVVAVSVVAAVAGVSAAGLARPVSGRVVGAGSVVWAVRRVAMSAPQRSREMRTGEMYPRATAPQPASGLAVRESP